MTENEKGNDGADGNDRDALLEHPAGSRKTRSREIHILLVDDNEGDILLTVNEEFHVLQVVREALSNTVRHARAAHVSVSLTSTPGGPVVAAVQDDGRGFSQAIAEPQHYGLSIMHERAASLGGELSINAQEDAGTRVCLTFLPASATAQPPAPY